MPPGLSGARGVTGGQKWEQLRGWQRAHRQDRQGQQADRRCPRGEDQLQDSQSTSSSAEIKCKRITLSFCFEDVVTLVLHLEVELAVSIASVWLLLHHSVFNFFGTPCTSIYYTNIFGGPKRPPSICNIVIIWASPPHVILLSFCPTPLCNNVLILTYPPKKSSLWTYIPDVIPQDSWYTGTFFGPPYVIL